MARFRAAILDVDGLLIDTEPIWRQVEIEVFASVGLHLTEEQCLQTMGVRVAQVVELWYSRQPWQGLSTGEVTRRIEQGVIGRVLSSGEPKPGVIATLDLLDRAGLPIALASSSSEALIDAVVRRLDIAGYIRVICSADREAEGKPHPAVFLTAARRLGVPPEACLAFEDSPNGIQSAKAAGMFCIAVPDPYLASDPRMDLADLRLSSLEEFASSSVGQLISTS